MDEQSMEQCYLVSFRMECRDGFYAPQPKKFTVYDHYLDGAVLPTDITARHRRARQEIALYIASVELGGHTLESITYRSCSQREMGRDEFPTVTIS